MEINEDHVAKILSLITEANPEVKELVMKLEDDLEDKRCKEQEILQQESNLNDELRDLNAKFETLNDKKEALEDDLEEIDMQLEDIKHDIINTNTKLDEVHKSWLNCKYKDNGCNVDCKLNLHDSSSEQEDNILKLCNIAKSYAKRVEDVLNAGVKY